MLYLAYGSNLHIAQMLRRCHKAIKIGATTIPNMRLVFRGVADVEPCEGSKVHVGVWHITRECERSLDLYEGVRSGLYRKEYLPLRITRNGVETQERALIYKMNSASYAEPGQFYYDTIRIGYENFGLPEAALIAADKFSRKAERNDRETTRAARAGKLGVVE